MTEDDLTRLFTTSSQPDAAAMKAIKDRLEAALTPVKPLPSDSVLWGIGFAMFVVLSVALAMFKGLKAITALSAGEMAAYYGLMLAFGALFSRAVVERMIPGTKRLMSSAILPVVAFVAIGVLMLLLFEDRSTVGFGRGVACLRFGATSALLSGLLGWGLFRKGYLVSPVESIAMYGLLAGLTGVAVLALHCPIRNSLHCLVWHLGAMMLAGLAGVLLGKLWDNRGYAD